jgi:hypothetical protein
MEGSSLTETLREKIHTISVEAGEGHNEQEFQDPLQEPFEEQLLEVQRKCRFATGGR